MKTTVIVLLMVLSATLSGCGSHHSTGPLVKDTLLISDTIQYHAVRVDQADGSILPWFSSDRGASYDTVLMLVWDFWKNMETDSNGLKYYMNHQVWRPEHDLRGLGGDQFNMALSSWTLLYAYTGDKSVLANMKYIADTYLERSLSNSSDAWPYVPYPYNTVIHSGIYDGDMRNGKGITQPDKAGTFGYELSSLYKITGDRKYLEAAVRIAGTLMKHLEPGMGKSHHSIQGQCRTETGSLFDNMEAEKTRAHYTANWTGTLCFSKVAAPATANSGQYKHSFNMLDWMKAFPQDKR
jgi:hypothetical protein